MDQSPPSSSRSSSPATAASPTPTQQPTSPVFTQTPPNLLATCPKCHSQVRPTDFFCSNCGQDLHNATQPVSLATQISLYLGSLILPPFGIIWGLRYLKKPNPRAKFTGALCIILTLVALVAITVYLVNLVNFINQQVQLQTENLLRF